MIILSVNNAWPKGEETFHSIPIFDPSLIIIFLSAVTLGIGVFVYLKLRKRKKQ